MKEGQATRIKRFDHDLMIKKYIFMSSVVISAGACAVVLQPEDGRSEAKRARLRGEQPIFDAGSWLVF